MPIKVEMELEDFNLEGEPLYDNKALEAYCLKNHKEMKDLSEEEKRAFIIGYMTL